MNSEERTVVDLSTASDITELVTQINTIIESDNLYNKSIYLNLGKINLKQSQLLSIKALIETLQASIAGIETSSEMTEASAIGLGISVGICANSQPQQNQEISLPNINQSEYVSEAEINSFAQLKKVGMPSDNSEKIQEPTKEANTETNIETEHQLEPEYENDKENYNETEFDNNINEDLKKESEQSEEIQSALDVVLGVKQDITSTNDSDYEVFAKPQEIKDTFDDYEISETTEVTDEGKYVLLNTEGITPEGVELIKSNTSDLETLYLTQTLRSGQTVSFEGNIFIIGDCHPGSEVIATGDVTVWGILGGIVHAGSKGNPDAKVRALKLNPIQLRIATLYSRRNDTINVPYVQKSNEFTPEEARIEKEQIVIYKTLRRED